MIVLSAPTRKELGHIQDLVHEGWIVLAEQTQPAAEVAPVEGSDGGYYATYEKHGPPYVEIWFS